MSPLHNDLLKKMTKVVCSAAKTLEKTYYRNIHKKEAPYYKEKYSNTFLPDYVTEIEKEIEYQIRNALFRDYPRISFIGEESQERLNTIENKDQYFLLDPIDGTMNFITMRDYFSISLAYIENNQVKIGVIANPISNLLFYACANQGAFCVFPSVSQNKHQIQVSEISHLREYQLDCEITFTDASDFDIVKRAIPYISGIRKSGSTALDICMIAMGRKSALIATHLESYDLAAGLVVGKEAGMIISDFAGNSATIDTKKIIAAPRQIHKKLLDYVM